MTTSNAPGFGSEHQTDDNAHLPTPDEIEIACQQIRNGWSGTRRRQAERPFTSAAVTIPCFTSTGELRQKTSI